jgi:anti-sigma regulatory factor (Ser/Thr protein kinase)
VARLLSLRPQPADVRVARDFCCREIQAALGRYRNADDRRDSELNDHLNAGALITSELVTNAIRAGARRIHLRIERRPGRVRIAVIDDADGAVVPGPELSSHAADPLASAGRGLRLVAAYASAWGVSDGPEGKQVWAHLDLPVSNQYDGVCDAAVS